MPNLQTQKKVLFYCQKITSLIKIAYLVFPFILLGFLVFKDISPTIVYSYLPGKKSLLFKKEQAHPCDSPLGKKDGQKVVVLNQPGTNFFVTLPDIFESITLKVKFHPGESQSLFLHPTGHSDQEIGGVMVYGALVEQLREHNWQESREGEFTIFTDPEISSDFPDFWTFSDPWLWDPSQRSEPKILSVKKNFFVQLRTFEKVPLDEFAYFAMENKLLAQISKRGTNGIFVGEVTITPNQDLRKRGAKLPFSLANPHYEQGAEVYVIEIKLIGERKVITFGSLLESLKRVVIKVIP